MGIVLFLGGQSLYSQTKKERKEQKAKEIKEMIDEQRFTIDVDRALPMGGRTVNLTTPYSFEMRGDSAISYLPYFGRAYSLPYGGFVCIWAANCYFLHVVDIQWQHVVFILQ